MTTTKTTKWFAAILAIVFATMTVVPAMAQEMDLRGVIQQATKIMTDNKQIPAGTKVAVVNVYKSTGSQDKYIQSNIKTLGDYVLAEIAKELAKDKRIIVVSRAETDKVLYDLFQKTSADEITSSNSRFNLNNAREVGEALGAAFVYSGQLYGWNGGGYGLNGDWLDVVANKNVKYLSPIGLQNHLLETELFTKLYFGKTLDELALARELVKLEVAAERAEKNGMDIDTAIQRAVTRITRQYDDPKMTIVLAGYSYKRKELNDYIFTQMAQLLELNDRVTVVSRADTEQALKQIGFTPTSTVKPDIMLKLGKALNATHVVFGIQGIQDKRFDFSYNMINTGSNRTNKGVADDDLSIRIRITETTPFVQLRDGKDSKKAMDMEKRDSLVFNMMGPVVPKTFDSISAKLKPGTRVSLLPPACPDRAAAKYLFDELYIKFINANYVMTDRNDLDKAIAEINFGLSGMVSDDTAAIVGRILGAEVIVFGEIEDFRTPRQRMVFRAVQVKDGALLQLAQENIGAIEAVPEVATKPATKSAQTQKPDTKKKSSGKSEIVIINTFRLRWWFTVLPNYGKGTASKKVYVNNNEMETVTVPNGEGYVVYFGSPGNGNGKVYSLPILNDTRITIQALDYGEQNSNDGNVFRFVSQTTLDGDAVKASNVGIGRSEIVIKRKDNWSYYQDIIVTNSSGKRKEKRRVARGTTVTIPIPNGSGYQVNGYKLPELNSTRVMVEYRDEGLTLVDTVAMNDPSGMLIKELAQKAVADADAALGKVRGAIAVLPVTTDKENAANSDFAMDQLTAALIETGKYTLVEKNRVEELMAERKFQVSGMVSDTAKTIGQLLNADAVILGSLTGIGQSQELKVRVETR